MINVVMVLFGQLVYFGKVMIKNKVYIDRVIGMRENLIERVFIDVLSYDIFEVVILQFFYVGFIYFLEVLLYNFVIWNI